MAENSEKKDTPLKASQGVRHILDATRFSIKGIAATQKTEAAFRQELFLAVILIPAACFLPVAPVNRILMIVSLLLILLVELLNSALESIVDMVSPDYHELAGKAKDCGSAAVMFSLFIAGVVWALSLWQTFVR
ncbi:MAG: diacylglycerol kinase [Acidobacteria bacterium CG_4_9_14_3_um_filter_49_7]|nr:diacylglycerol kinase [Desulfuromonadales bacterium]PJB78956.1 MAG: diacylglycerol kinase [Acidobacteria bacterium CG_4_9_14_3_um_filter_49_7]